MKEEEEQSKRYKLYILLTSHIVCISGYSHNQWATALRCLLFYGMEFVFSLLHGNWDSIHANSSLSHSFWKTICQVLAIAAAWLVLISRSPVASLSLLLFANLYMRTHIHVTCSRTSRRTQNKLMCGNERCSVAC